MSELKVPTCKCDNCDNDAQLISTLHGCKTVVFCAECLARWIYTNIQSLALRPAVCSVCLSRVITSPEDWGVWREI